MSGRTPRRSAVLAFIGLVAATSPAAAHPAGRSSVDRYLYFQRTAPAAYRVAYRLDFAEASALVELDALDANHDGSLTPEEQRRYLESRVPQLVSEWNVEVNGAREVPTVVACHLDLVAGLDGSQTMQINCELRVEGTPPPARADETLKVRDRTFFDRPGARVIVEGEGTEPRAPSSGVVIEPRDGGSAPKTPRIFEATFSPPPFAEVHGLAERRRGAAWLLAPLVVVAVILVARWLWSRRAPR